ncbi:MAG: DMT family transporter, partial [Helicobacteraceae bacterium]|nr:DMT family transporter [Helicobacteraceae bacterium]
MNRNLLAIMMVFAMIAWGMSWSSIKIMNGYMPTAELVFTRYAITAIALFFVVLLLKLRFFIDKKSLIIAISTAFITVIYGYVVFLGTELGTASLAGALINALSPINTFIIMAIFYKRGIEKLDIFALGLGFAGTMLMLGAWRLDASKIFTAYNLYFALGAWLWSILTVAISKATINSIVFSFYMYFFTTLFALLFIDVGAFNLADTDAKFWINALFVSVISTAIATTIFFLGSKRLGANYVSSFMFVTPVSAIAFGAYALGEKLELWTIIGAIGAIAAVYMLNRIGLFSKK